jgi:Arc/MetJ-type ribon-helix-helix transcriptional regulator
MIDEWVKRGVYSSRSDAVRDGVRRLFWENQRGTINLKGSSVEIVRDARKKLSKQKFDIDEINNL